MVTQGGGGGDGGARRKTGRERERERRRCKASEIANPNNPKLSSLFGSVWAYLVVSGCLWLSLVLSCGATSFSFSFCSEVGVAAFLERTKLKLWQGQCIVAPWLGIESALPISHHVCSCFALGPPRCIMSCLACSTGGRIAVTYLLDMIRYDTIRKEDAVLVEKRSFLLMRQQRLKAALGKIESFAPDVLAVSK